MATKKEKRTCREAMLLNALGELVLAFHGLPIRPEQASSQVERDALEQALAAMDALDNETEN